MSFSSDEEFNSTDSQLQHSRLKNALTFRSKDVGGYRLGKTLGKGSCAVVKLGIHRDTGKHAAIKILKPRTLREQKEALREVEALQRLDHPNITKLHQVIRENGYTCLILELSAGGELFDYIMSNGKLDEEEARFMFRQILSGLQYCHANLVAHRDLKPENLLMDEYGNIKISDFGLSNVIKPGRMFSTWCGSPVYTPPEVVLRQQYNGIAMDVWSLGVVLYVLVTGGMPWRLESNVVKNMDDLIVGNYDIPDFLGVSDECRELIGMMLMAKSEDRATLETIMNHKWTCAGFGCPPDPQLEAKPLVQAVNEHIFMQLVSMGYDSERARTDIATNPHSPALTAYHLLLAKHARAQKVKSCQVNDASQVSSPAQFLHTIARTRSGSYPTSPPLRSPLAYRNSREMSARDLLTSSAPPASPRTRRHAATIAVPPSAAAAAIAADVGTGAAKKEKGMLRSFFGKFKFKNHGSHAHNKKSAAKDAAAAGTGAAPHIRASHVGSAPHKLSPSPANSRRPRPVTMIVEHNSPKSSPAMARRRI